MNQSLPAYTDLRDDVAGVLASLDPDNREFVQGDWERFEAAVATGDRWAVYETLHMLFIHVQDLDEDAAFAVFDCWERERQRL